MTPQERASVPDLMCIIHAETHTITTQYERIASKRCGRFEYAGSEVEHGLGTVVLEVTPDMIRGNANTRSMIHRDAIHHYTVDEVRPGKRGR